METSVSIQTVAAWLPPARQTMPIKPQSMRIPELILCKPQGGTRKFEASRHFKESQSIIAPMAFAELSSVNQNVRAILMLITFAGLGALGGCGGGWQPGPRDKPHDQMRSGIEGSGLNGP